MSVPGLCNIYGYYRVVGISMAIPTALNATSFYLQNPETSIASTMAGILTGALTSMFCFSAGIKAHEIMRDRLEGSPMGMTRKFRRTVAAQITTFSLVTTAALGVVNLMNYGIREDFKEMDRAQVAAMQERAKREVHLHPQPQIAALR